VTPGAVSQWFRRAREGGVEALRRQRTFGRTPKLTAVQLSRLPNLLTPGAEPYSYRGQVWTTKRVADLIHCTFGEPEKEARATGSPAPRRTAQPRIRARERLPLRPHAASRGKQPGPAGRTDGGGPRQWERLAPSTGPRAGALAKARHLGSACAARHTGAASGSSGASPAARTASTNGACNRTISCCTASALASQLAWGCSRRHWRHRACRSAGRGASAPASLLPSSSPTRSTDPSSSVSPRRQRPLRRPPAPSSDRHPGGQMGYRFRRGGGGQASD
jgi:hypothetical protein